MLRVGACRVATDPPDGNGRRPPFDDVGISSTGQPILSDCFRTIWIRIAH